MSLVDVALEVNNFTKHNIVVSSDTSDPSAFASRNVVLLPSDDVQYIGHPRASSLYSCCIRMHVIGTKLRLRQSKKISFNMKLTYGFGKAVHLWAQNDPDLLGNRRRGFWKCLSCGTMTKFMSRPMSSCPSCSAMPSAYVYHEHAFCITGSVNLTGHPDMFISTPSGAIRILELKTISEDLFLNLKSPSIEHKWQVMSYLFACLYDKEIPRSVDTDIGYILYIAKKSKTKIFPLKMFQIKIDHEIIDEIKSKLMKYTIGLTDYPKSIPHAHKLCLSSKFSCYRAKTCPCIDECRRLL